MFHFPRHTHRLTDYEGRDARGADPNENVSNPPKPAQDSNEIIADLDRRGAKVVISQHPRRTIPLMIDAQLYKWRHLIENFFCKLKEFKR
ncbi:MAG: hypothetical protein ACREDP_24940, partial [Bradyrhizobium sp.]